MTPAELAADRAVCDAATPGPWWEGEERRHDKPIGACISYGGYAGLRPYNCIAEINLDMEGCFGFVGVEQALKNRAFIAAARTRWPAALDRIEQLQAENRRLWSALREIADATVDAATMNLMAARALKANPPTGEPQTRPSSPSP